MKKKKPIYTFASNYTVINLSGSFMQDYILEDKRFNGRKFYGCTIYYFYYYYYYYYYYCC